jgi:hypothetical protein
MTITGKIVSKHILHYKNNNNQMAPLGEIIAEKISKQSIGR